MFLGGISQLRAFPIMVWPIRSFWQRLNFISDDKIYATRNEMPKYAHQNIELFRNAAEMKLHVNRTCFHAGLKSLNRWVHFASHVRTYSKNTWSHLASKVANKCLNVSEQVEVVDRNKQWSPPLSCCPVNRQCLWKKTLIVKKKKLWIYLTHCSSLLFADFEHVNGRWNSVML